MKIGIVTTWFERGAAYVSKTYMNLFESYGHRVFIFARGGDGKPDKHSNVWNESYVTRDKRYNDTRVNKRKFYNWIKNNNLDLILFNEQQHFLIVALTKKKFPNIKIGAYIDYYKEDTIPLFNIYDFVICNTKRHLQAMANHPQAFYLKWGVDTDLYLRKTNFSDLKQPVFFHSAGMSKRKGTDILVDAFIEGKLYESSKLIIHTQKPVQNFCKYTAEELHKYSIEVIEKTVGAPGLYELGDIYVYPTRLDGLGLTLYEALSFGMPVITTDYPPMNEAIDKEVGSLVRVADHYCRSDAYYYPMSICDKEDLIFQMRKYINNSDLIRKQSCAARSKALSEYSLSKMGKELNNIMKRIVIRPMDYNAYNLIIKTFKSPLYLAIQKISENNNFLRFLKYKIRK